MKILVKYDIESCDHDGYCSGSEANTEHPEKYINYEIINTNENITDVSQLDKYFAGCTSKNGSGYCNGYYTTKKALKYEIIPTEKCEKLHNVLVDLNQANIQKHSIYSKYYEEHNKLQIKHELELKELKDNHIKSINIHGIILHKLNRSHKETENEIIDNYKEMGF